MILLGNVGWMIHALTYDEHKVNKCLNTIGIFFFQQTDFLDTVNY
jgi:hypothetical protein